MASRILVGYDGSEASRAALDFAGERAKALGKRVVLVNVVPANVRHLAFSELLLPQIDLTKLVKVDKFRDVARKRLEEAAAGLRKRGVEVEAVVRAGDTADELLAAAREEGVEEVVLGYMSYEHSLPYGIGSVAEKVLRYCDRTVTVVRPAAARDQGEAAGPAAKP